MGAVCPELYIFLPNLGWGFVIIAHSILAKKAVLFVMTQPSSNPKAINPEASGLNVGRHTTDTHEPSIYNTTCSSSTSCSVRPSSLIGKYYTRSKKVFGLLTTLAGGFRQAHRIDAFREPPRDILPKYIQVFCRKATQAIGVPVVALEPVPQVHALWACNHISWVDIAVVGSVSPAFFLSKAEIGRWPIFGKLAHAAGTLFIQRGSGDAGTVSEQIADFLRTGHSVLFFPEATTTDGRQIKRIHGKLLAAAKQANTPIQPMVICYVDAEGKLSDAVPYFGDIQMKDSLRHVIDSKGITAYVLPLESIDPSDYELRELTELLQSRMQAGLARLHQRVLAS